ncbi:MAG: antibiotic biosynthesis monooxygenase [Bacteroidota bacterium]
MKIKRIWHGWTTHENANQYQELLHKVIFPGIEAKSISGFRSVELLRKELKDEVEFITIMTFDSLQNVIDFQGEAYEKSYIPEEAKKVLKRWNDEADHFQIIESRNYPQLS